MNHQSAINVAYKRLAMIATRPNAKAGQPTIKEEAAFVEFVEVGDAEALGLVPEVEEGVVPFRSVAFPLKLVGSLREFCTHSDVSLNPLRAAALQTAVIFRSISGV